MILTMMKAKIHRVPVTQCDMNYNGSISIDAEWLKQTDILPNEQVDVLNINTGSRFTTYVIESPAGSKTIGINGAAARLAQIGDLVIIVAYAQMSDEIARKYSPKVISPV
jgi:aspartate 1-decarboxylase